MRHLLLVCIVFLFPSFAFAQDSPPVIEVRGAFGLSHYLHGDLGYTAPAWLAALRFGSGSFAVEGEVAGAAHERRDVFGPASAQTVTVSKDAFRSLAANVLGRWGSRASVYAGGGPGVYWEKSRYEVQAANGYELTSTRGPRLGAQIVGGVDVPIVPRVKAFGQFRYEIRSFEDPGGGSVAQGFGGVAMVLK